MNNNSFILSNGYKIPVIGTGPGSPIPGRTWKWLTYIPFFGRIGNAIIRRINNHINKHQWVNSLSESLKIGYRLIDYSSAYGNEQLVKKAIDNSGLKREDVFIISRASNNDQFNSCVRESFMNSLKKIGVDYLDLYMFHWPVTGHFIETYKEIEKLYKEVGCPVLCSTF